jgi:hypothetical protein
VDIAGGLEMFGGVGNYMVWRDCKRRMRTIAAG